MANSLGMLYMSKRSFWSIFWPAWQQVFCLTNITSSFAKTGIWPYNPEPILSMITRPIPEAQYHSPRALKTPMTSHAVRRIQHQFRIAPNSPLLAKVFRANERLTAQHDIDQHQLQGLKDAFEAEKKKRQRGKRLNLLGEEGTGPQFFSPARIEAAKAYQASKDEEEVQRQQGIQEKKAQAANKRIEKVERPKIATEKKAQKAIEKQLQKSLQESIRQPIRKPAAIPKRCTKLSKTPNQRSKQPSMLHGVIAANWGEGGHIATASGRSIQRPARFAQ